MAVDPARIVLHHVVWSDWGLLLPKGEVNEAMSDEAATGDPEKPDSDAEAPSSVPASDEPTDDGIAQETNPTEDPTDDGFGALGLPPSLVATLDRLGYVTPTPIQAQAIPLLLDGSDVRGSAATGTGKTAAFVLPIVAGLGAHRTRDRGEGRPAALVLTPTRELAVQVAKAAGEYGAADGLAVATLYGGDPIGRQLGQLRRGVDLAVGTPGRVLDLLDRGALDTGNLVTLVLDEADEMLDMGFADDLDAIVDALPEDRQTVLFSATMPRRVLSLADRHQRDAVVVAIDRPADDGPSLIDERLHWVKREHKMPALRRLLESEDVTAGILFCRTRADVDRVTAELSEAGHRAEALHGGLDQHQRERVLGRLRSGSTQFLVATDVAARGLDVDGLTHVINVDVPESPAAYVHRIGRVGRAGRTGVAICLAEPRNRRLVADIEREVGRKLPVAEVPSAAEMGDRRRRAIAASVEGRLASGPSSEALRLATRLIESSGDDSAVSALAAALEQLIDDRSPGHEPDIPSSPPAPRRDRHTSKDRDRSSQGRTGRTGDARPARRGRQRGGSASVYVGLGRKAGVRPGDLVGAIANETGLRGDQIGPIKVAEHHSVVGVPDGDIDRVIAAMRATSIRGRKAKVRRFVD